MIRLYNIICFAAVVVVHILSIGCSVIDGFSNIPSFTSRIKTGSRHSTFLQSTDNSDASSEAQKLKDKANQYRAEAEKLSLTLGLQKINELGGEIRDFVNSDGTVHPRVRVDE